MRHLLALLVLILCAGPLFSQCGVCSYGETLSEVPGTQCLWNPFMPGYEDLQYSSWLNATGLLCQLELDASLSPITPGDLVLVYFDAPNPGYSPPLPFDTCAIGHGCCGIVATQYLAPMVWDQTGQRWHITWNIFNEDLSGLEDLDVYFQVAGIRGTSLSSFAPPWHNCGSCGTSVFLSPAILVEYE